MVFSVPTDASHGRLYWRCIKPLEYDYTEPAIPDVRSNILAKQYFSYFPRCQQATSFRCNLCLEYGHSIQYSSLLPCRPTFPCYLSNSNSTQGIAQGLLLVENTNSFSIISGSADGLRGAQCSLLRLIGDLSIFGSVFISHWQGSCLQINFCSNVSRYPSVRENF